MSKEVYRRLSKAERKLENTNRLRSSNSTLRIKYEGIKKLLEKKDKEIERLHSIIKEVKKYIMTELISEWDIKNGGCVSGSDLPVYAITPILEMLDKDSDKE